VGSFASVGLPTLAGLRTSDDARVSLVVADERRRVAAVIVVSACARIALAAAIGLGVDESYAAAVARPVSLSYFDHPPLAFWITAAAERVFGTGSDVLLRLPFIVLFAGTTWLMYRLTARLFGERAGLLAAILVSLIPVFGVSDGGWILPDGPLLFAIAAVALCLAHIVTSANDEEARRWWYLVGLSIGAALLSKYHAALLVGGMLAFFATSPRHRRWFAKPEPYVAAAIALAFAVPVVVWNARHGWVSFRFQSARASIHDGGHVSALLQALAGQAGYMLPWIWVPLAFLFVSALRRGPTSNERWLLACLGGGPILLFTLIALGGRPGLPHWPAPGWFLIVPLLADALARRERSSPFTVRAYFVGSAAVVAALVVLAASQIRTGWVSRRLPALFGHGDPSLDALDWAEVRQPLSAVARSNGLGAVIASDWIEAAKLGAALAPDIGVLCFNEDSRHFRFVADRRPPIDGDVLVVLRQQPNAGGQLVRDRLASYFQSLDSIGTIPLHRGRDVVVRLTVYRGRTLLRMADGSLPR
jgi:4-amino-4-deoxy-L-arabinose transferase-like glycosyltransferase